MAVAPVPSLEITAARVAAALLAMSREELRDAADTHTFQQLLEDAARIDSLGVAEILKAEAERQLHVLPVQSASIAAMLADLAVVSRSPDLAGLSALAAADALREQGRYVEALGEYDRAGRLYSAAGNDVGWARTRIGATYTRRYTGELDLALDETDRARDILAAHKLWLRVARLESVVGLVLREHGRNSDALIAYGRALQAAHQLTESEDRDLLDAELSINQATIYLQLDQYEQAAALLESAAATFLQHGRPSAMAQAEADRARALAAQGRLSEALALVAQVRLAVRALGRPADGALVGQVGIDCLLQLNRPEESEALADQVVSEFEANGADVELAKTLVQRALARERAGRSNLAAADLERAEALFRRGGCAGWVAIVRLQRAELLERNGAPEEACREAVLAGQDLRRRRQVVAGARADLVRARAFRQLEKPAPALAAARAARAVGVRQRVPWLRYYACRLLGELARDAGNVPVALRAFGQAVQALEETQGHIVTEQRASFLQDKLEVYQEAVRLCLQSGNIQGAFAYAERGKARALLDALVLKNYELPLRPTTEEARVLAAELTRLRRRAASLSSVLFDPRRTRGTDLPESDPSGELRSELAQCEARIATLLEELRLGGAADLERLALLRGHVYSPLHALEGRSALIEYVVVGNAIAVFVLRRGHRLQSAWLRGDNALAEVARLTRFLDLNLTTASQSTGDLIRLRALEVQARAVLARLHSVLLGPIKDLLHGAEHLVIVPHGVLHSIPFAALHDGAAYLVESYEVTLAPSASTVTFCHRPLRDERLPGELPRSLVIAHSAGGLVPEALAEAEAVAAHFPGECLLESAATLSNVTGKAGDVQLVHVAAHGLSRQDAPLFSHVALADGQLTALDCLELELDCALVTLSACETGRAVVAPGDEPIGLTRSLLYAGARSVLQSLWRVEDRATRQLMDEFYGRLRSGSGRGAALRAAQRMVLADERGLGSGHPFFWAAFELVGAWRPIVGDEKRRASRTQQMKRGVGHDER